MDFGLYLVPVLSGYWFLTHLHYTNYKETPLNGALGRRCYLTFNLRDYGKVPELFNIAVMNPAEALRRVRNV